MQQHDTDTDIINFLSTFSSVGERESIWAFGEGGKIIFIENVDLGAKNNPLKFPPTKLCASSSVARFSLWKSVFCLYLVYKS